PSGVSRVDISINDGIQTTLLSSLSGAGPLYTTNWNITQLAEGPYVVLIEAFDSLNNATNKQFPVSIQFLPPEPPVITSPVSSTVTTESIVELIGNSTVGTTVDIFRAGQPMVGGLVVSSNGNFATNITLEEGDNIFTAKANGIGGQSASSAPVTIKLDTSVPDAPTGLNSYSKQNGEIRLDWLGVQSVTPIAYDVYRSDLSFSEIEEAEKVNSTPISVTSFSDFPEVDGTYYYRVLAVNSVGATSDLSNQTVATSDSIPPKATEITYTTDTLLDPLIDVVGPGIVFVKVTVSEKLLAVPFLSYAFAKGSPINVPLVQSGETEYQGSFEVTELTANGLGTAVFSARDLVANQGSEVELGSTIVLDSRGPQVESITVVPESPIKNDSQSPVAVTATFDLSEKVADGTTPEFKYLLSQTVLKPAALPPATLINPEEHVWQVNFTLPSSAGLSEAETLSFAYLAQDAIGNIADTIDVLNSFEIYQGELPALDAPTGLKGKAIKGGRIELSWNSVAQASGYQLYRKAPSESSLTPYGAILQETSFTDSTAVDDEHMYAVASVRNENGQQSLSALSSAVTVLSDSVPYSAPQSLMLEMSGAGVVATWQAPLDVLPGEQATYALYRQALAPGQILDPSGTEPIIENILGLAAVDPSPSEAEHAYAVIAIDEAGNESIVSNTAYLNFTLVPVSTLSVKRMAQQYPVISWSYTGTGADKFRLEFKNDDQQQVLYEGADTEYTDTGYSVGERLYTVYGVDINSVESVGREILLPNVTVAAQGGLTIQRGVFNSLQFTANNQGSIELNSLKIAVTVGGITYRSAEFELTAGQSKEVPVVVAGTTNLPDTAQVTVTLEYEPASGELVELTQETTATVVNKTLVYTIESQDLVLGATGNVRFKVENTSDVLTEIITAKGTGSLSSDELRVVLTDNDKNIYSTTPVLQFFGGTVVTLPDGTTVARIEPHKTFTSEWFPINVPSNVPQDAQLRLEVDAIHYSFSTPLSLTLPGGKSTSPISLVEPPYYGEITSVTPASSFEDDIVITGRALDSETDLAEAFRELDLIFSISGFEYKKKVTTDQNGEFVYKVVVENFAAGAYVISAVYPGGLDRPEQGSFTIDKLSLNYSVFNLNAPINYIQPFGVTVTAGPATQATGVGFEYLAEDQNGQTLPTGISFELPQKFDILPGETKPIEIKFTGDSTAATLGQVYLRLVSNETGNKPLATLRVDYKLSLATPVINFTPSVLETG
ncbi:MAG: hypothetical protein KDD53_03910, partial [Bdellovibrionales bacterium]|nr:hypothetical protein [Bdellovibrionales bacterium]